MGNQKEKMGQIRRIQQNQGNKRQRRRETGKSCNRKGREMDEENVCV